LGYDSLVEYLLDAIDGLQDAADAASADASV